MERVYGIDLGTTYSCISYVDEFGKAVVLPNNENERTTPSAVFFDEGNVIVGSVAKESAKLYPEQVVSYIKRSMGNGEYYFEYKGDTFRPEEISSFILKKLVKDGQEQLGEEIRDVVITCPAYFGINEREATKVAGEIAGLNVRQVLNEPTAAAVAYGIENKEEKVVLVYDLGGGTFDVSMIDIKSDEIKVICTGGDHSLGGKDFDDRIIYFLQEQFIEQTGVNEDILNDLETAQELQNSAERAKKILSSREMVPVSVSFNGDRAKVNLTRDKFEELTADLLQRTILLTSNMLEEAKKKGYESFDEVLLVGGSTRMPMVRESLVNEFSIEPRLFDPDEVVAKGAAQYGYNLSINDEMVRRISDSTGDDILEVIEGIEEKTIDNGLIDTVLEELSEDTGFRLSSVKNANMKITNVVSKSFGVVAIDNSEREIVSNLIIKNNNVPCEVTKVYGTNEDNQELALIRIMENEVSDDVVLLESAKEVGTAELRLPEGLPYNSPILITFKLNEDGRLEIKGFESDGESSIDATFETKSVITGEELQEAKERSKNIRVS